MHFAIGVTVLECSFVKHSHGPLGIKVVHFSHSNNTYYFGSNGSSNF
jgi:hypothetical protein